VWHATDRTEAGAKSSSGGGFPIANPVRQAAGPTPTKVEMAVGPEIIGGSTTAAEPCSTKSRAGAGAHRFVLFWRQQFSL
jgi:hypothetical protein